MDYEVPCISGKIINRDAEVKVPGSKSITARAALISALADGTSVLYGIQNSDDCATFLNCLKSVGIDRSLSGTTLTVHGCGGRIPVSSGEVYVGSAGTAARFMTALLALSDGKFLLRASEQMKKRPVSPLIHALRDAGANFEFLEKEDCFPFIVRGCAASVNKITVDIAQSSQFLSALLMAAVCLKDGLEIEVKGAHGMKYVQMTADIMRCFGASVERKNGIFSVKGGYRAREYAIEPDISAACYFYAMNRILDTRISVAGVTPQSIQGDIKFIELLNSGFDGGEADMSAFSDQALTLAAIAPYFSKPTKISGIAHIRGQECDRINAICTNLKRMGVECREYEDGVEIFPGKIRGAHIETFGDHRVAMSFAVTGLRSEGIVIDNAEVCKKTFPEYFAVLDALAAELVLPGQGAERMS